MTSIESQTPSAGHSEESEGQPLLSSNVLIHIGLRKTGSNWLRRNVLGVDDKGFWVPGDMEIPGIIRGRGFMRQLFMDHKGRLFPDEEFDPAPLREQLETFVVPAGKCAVFTAARLGGHPLSNGIDRGQLCNRVKQVFPNARILIVIREQRSMILSSYIEHLEGGGADTLKYFIDGKWDASCPVLTYHFFKYDRLIRLYQSAFGADNVLTLPMEMISKTPMDFINRICQFNNIAAPENLPFEEKSNARTEYFPYVALRYIVPHFRSSRGNAYSPALLGREPGKAAHRFIVAGMSKLVPRSLDMWVKRRLQRQVEDLTKDIYVTSNRESEKLTGLDLGAFGYRV